jgi:hypothetical protein
MKAVAAAESFPAGREAAASAIPLPEPVQESQARPKAFYAATRIGKKKATVTLSAAAHRQLKLLAVDHGGVEVLLTEAINDLFRKHGQQPLA